MQDSTEQSEPVVQRGMRRLLLMLVTAGMVGTAADLVLLEHYEDAWQLPPLALIGFALLVVAWLLVSNRPFVVIVLRTLMIGLIAAGCFGIVLHFRGNREFQREIDPTIEGWALIQAVMTAKAPPALAPASMIQLGLLGLLYTYRHPSLAWRGPDQPQNRTTA
jgi:hypothetical protein